MQLKRTAVNAGSVQACAVIFPELHINAIWRKGLMGGDSSDDDQRENIRETGPARNVPEAVFRVDRNTSEHDQ